MAHVTRRVVVALAADPALRLALWDGAAAVMGIVTRAAFDAGRRADRAKRNRPRRPRVEAAAERRATSQRMLRGEIGSKQARPAGDVRAAPQLRLPRAQTGGRMAPQAGTGHVAQPLRAPHLDVVQLEIERGRGAAVRAVAHRAPGIGHHGVRRVLRGRAPRAAQPRGQQERDRPCRSRSSG